MAVEVLSSENSENLQFDGLTDVCVELGVRLGNSIFANHEKGRLDMKKKAEEISKKYDFFDDQDDKKDVKIKSDTDIDDIEAIPYSSPKWQNDIDDIGRSPYASPKRENDIDDIETIPYASLKTENTLMIRKQSPMLPQEGKMKLKLTKKYRKNQNLKLQLRLKNKLQREREKNLSKVNWNKKRY